MGEMRERGGGGGNRKILRGEIRAMDVGVKKGYLGDWTVYGD